MTAAIAVVVDVNDCTTGGADKFGHNQPSTGAWEVQ